MPLILFAAMAMVAQWKLCAWGVAWKGLPGGEVVRRALRVWKVVGVVFLSAPFGWLHPTLDGYLTQLPAAVWWMGMSLTWALCIVGLFPIVWVYRRLPPFDPKRRRFLGVGGAALVTAPFVMAGYGLLVERSMFRLREVDIGIAGLPADLEGLRLVQLSDIHLSPFLSEPELERVVDIANETRPHLALVTGDLITMRDELLTACLQRLKRLRTDAGVFGCMGNHELRAACQDRAKREGAALGLDFLRGEARQLHFGAATLNIAGVDYQPTSRPYLTGAGALRRKDSLNVLLSHNPDVFDVARNQGWDLTVSGHTHGGQVNVEILERHVNVARFFTPYVYGLYQQGASSIYVTRGIGTVGIPARIGAPPEIALLRLCAT
ncbi:MAG: metallophosphoesterase [bacterium]|nr:metallophosphoesterase [bacterium]